MDESSRDASLRNENVKSDDGKVDSRHEKLPVSNVKDLQITAKSNGFKCFSLGYGLSSFFGKRSLNLKIVSCACLFFVCEVKCNREISMSILHKFICHYNRCLYLS